MLIEDIIKILEKETAAFMPPLIDCIVEEFGSDPYLILIGCLLSLRARDATTIHVCRELFACVKTPEELLSLLSVPELERIIFKTGFYRNKAQVLREVSATLLERFEGRVPATFDELISIRGIGPKTANLVLGMAFGIPGICVDTHVHRISNRLGVIATKTVGQTELELKRVLPKNRWIIWNKLLVMWGQNVCIPRSPKCSRCAVKGLCKRIGVMTSR
jgi:endonuclease-3